MNITRFSFKHHQLTLAFAIAVFVFGLYSFVTLPRMEDPSVTIRAALVVTQYPGMSPTRIEQLITQPLEEKIRGIPEVESITSNSKSGLSIIQVEIKDRYQNLNPIWNDLRNTIDDHKPYLPKGSIGPFVNTDYGRVSVATIAITHPHGNLSQLYLTAKHIRNKLYLTPGIQHIEILGRQEDRVYLETSNARMAQYGLTPHKIYNAIQKQNVISPGGVIHTPQFDILLEPSGLFKSLNDIRQVTIRVPQSQKVTQLGDILKVSRGYVDPPEKPSYFNEQPSVLLAVSMSQKENILQFAKQLNLRLDQIKTQLSPGYQLAFATYQPKHVERSIQSFTTNLYQTIFIVLVVVILALGLRTGLLVGSLVPMTILLSFVVMRFFDIELHRVSIASLIISLGLLIDNGIVVGESIYQRIQSGMDRKSAAMGVSQELSVPLLTSSLTTILSFMPLMLAEHVSSEYTRTLSIVIFITLLCAWFLAFYVLPLLCYYWIKLKPKEKSVEYCGAGYLAYQKALSYSLKHKVGLLSLTGLTLLISIFTFTQIPQRFFPESERNQFVIQLDMPNGTNIRHTQSTVKQILAWLNDKQKNPQITHTLSHVGGGGARFFLTLEPREQASNNAFILVGTKDIKSVTPLIQRTQRYLQQHYPDVQGHAKKLWLGTSETGAIALEIYGDQTDTLKKLAEKIKQALKATPGTHHIRDDWGQKTLKFLINIDMAKAQRVGVTAEDIALSLSSYYSGTSLGNFYINDLNIPIVLRASTQERLHLEHLNTVNIYAANSQKNFPLAQFASITPKFEYNQIRHKNLSRAVTVTAYNTRLDEAQTKKALSNIIAKLTLPPGYSVHIAGEVQSSSEARAALTSYFPLAFLLMFLLMIWQFNSWRRTLIIFISIPLGFIGGILGLLIMQAEFGFMTLLGFMSLAGIIINNAIVLIEKIDAERHQGQDLVVAIIEACTSRIRPLLLTAFTTALGLLPLISFGGPLWYGMANVIAFGLILGTFITLFVVPALYLWLSPPLFSRER